MGYYPVRSIPFLDALASLDFKLWVSQSFIFFIASASTGLSELFATKQCVINETSLCGGATSISNFFKLFLSSTVWNVPIALATFFHLSSLPSPVLPGLGRTAGVPSTSDRCAKPSNHPCLRSSGCHYSLSPSGPMTMPDTWSCRTTWSRWWCSTKCRWRLISLEPSPSSPPSSQSRLKSRSGHHDRSCEHHQFFHYHQFLDALASLDLKLSVSQ